MCFEENTPQNRNHAILFFQGHCICMSGSIKSIYKGTPSPGKSFKVRKTLHQMGAKKQNALKYQHRDFFRKKRMPLF